MKLKGIVIHKKIITISDDINHTAADRHRIGLYAGKKKLKVNLQLFADSGEKTEKATPRKKSKPEKRAGTSKSGTNRCYSSSLHVYRAKGFWRIHV